MAFLKRGAEIFLRFQVWVRVQRAYSRISLASKLLMFALAGLFITSVAWTVGHPLIGLEVSLVFSLVVHGILSWTRGIMTTLVWIGNIIMIPVTATLYATISPYLINSNQFAWLFLESTIISTVISIIFTILAVRYAKGRLWMTLLLVFLSMILGGIALAVWLSSISVGAVYGVFTGSIMLTIRIFLPRSHDIELDKMLDEDKQRLLAKMLSKGFVGGNSRHNDAIIVADKKGRVTFVYGASVISHISVSGKHGPTYQNFPISRWLASKIAETGAILSKTSKDPVAALTVIAFDGDHGIDKQKYIILSMSKDGLATDSKAIALISYHHADEALSLVMNDIDLVPATREQIEELAALG